jgi:3-oxoacyl-[acyl-carrier protein] reductase
MLYLLPGCTRLKPETRAPTVIHLGRYDMLLEGKVAIVTAAAGAGIGRAVATRFLEEGADVVVTDAHPRRTTEVAAELSKQFKREVLGIPVDVLQRAQIEGAVTQAVARFGRIDILFNNAASTSSSRSGSARTKPGTWF